MRVGRKGGLNGYPTKWPFIESKALRLRRKAADPSCEHFVENEGRIALADCYHSKVERKSFSEAFLPLPFACTVSSALDQTL